MVRNREDEAEQDQHHCSEPSGNSPSGDAERGEASFVVVHLEGDRGAERPRGRPESGRRGRFALLVGALLLATAACGGITESETDSPVFCTREFRFGIVIHARDAVTGGPIHPDAVAIAREGSYVEIVRGGQLPASGTLFMLAGERPGTYSVRVESPGYRLWERSNVVVTGDVCHVTPVQLTALLER